MTRSSSAGLSSGERLSMFDFNEDDERIETVSKKLLNKFVNPNCTSNKRKRRSLFSSPIDKYKFLECFAGCEKVEEVVNRSEPILVDDDEPIDVHSERRTEAPCKDITDEVVDTNAKGADSHKPTVSYPKYTVQEDSSAVMEITTLDAHVLPIPSNCENGPRGMILDGDEDDGCVSSSSTSVCTLDEDEVPLADPEPESCPVGHKIDILNGTVVVFPDFILYGDIYCTESRLTFSSSCIRVEGSAVNGSKSTFNAEWVVSDVISIVSEWCGRVETALVNLQLKPHSSERFGNANETSAIDKLKFSVYDPCWSEGQEAIKSLDVRYRDIWNVILDTEVVTGSNSMNLPKPYLHILDETLREVIYPKGDPDAVVISKRDVELLKPETFINDTIIDFYIKFLKNKIQPDKQHRFHFFNSFFFRKLADLDKDPSSVSEGQAAFQRVRKWTKKIDLFEKDYIFIPVNYSLHWSLIVICHPGEVAHFRDEECENALKVPCILHMDSIRGSHKGLKNLFQSYLYQEWKERQRESLDDVSTKFSCLPFVSLELPQQENSFDCGLFLLHYVELFLEDVPINFSPFKITGSSNYLSRSWFLPQEASLKRVHIRKLICEILEDQSQNFLQEKCVAKFHGFNFFNTNEPKNVVEFLEGKCGSAKMYQGDSSSPCNKLGIGIYHPSVSSLRLVQQQSEEIGSYSMGQFERGSCARQLSCRNYSRMESFCTSYMSPVEEANEAVEQISDSSSDHDYCCRTSGLATDACSSYFSEDFKSLEKSCGFNGLHVEDSYDDDLNDEPSSETSSSESQRSSEIGLDGDHLHHEYDSGETDREESSTSSEDLKNCVAEDSQEANCMHELNDPAPDDGKFSSGDITFRKDNKPMNNENMMSESDEQPSD